MRVVADGLRFPEGPVAMPDGSVIVVELFGRRITRVLPDGSLHTVAEVAGSPNGAAVGPDGALFVCNNGDSFSQVASDGMLFAGPHDPARYIGGRIQRVDLATGTVTDLYTECDGRPLRSPNDLVFDGHGGFYFTDHGIRDHHTRKGDLSSIHYALADGSAIHEVVFPTMSPNGVGLSPDGSTLYWAETHSSKVWRRRVTAPGVVAPVEARDPWTLLAGLPGLQLLDSMAIDGEGNVCVGTLVNGGITVISPHDGSSRHLAIDDPMVTNICFGDADGSGEYRDTYITAAATGRLLHTRWPNRGLRLHHQ